MHILKSHCLRRDSRWGPEQENECVPVFQGVLSDSPYTSVSGLGQVSASLYALYCTLAQEGPSKLDHPTVE